MESLNYSVEVFIKKKRMMEPSDNAEILYIKSEYLFDSDFMIRQLKQ